MEVLKTILSKFKIKEICIIVFISTIIITFLPENITDTMKLMKLKTDFQPYISVLLIISGACNIYWMAEIVFKKIKNKILAWKIKNQAKDYMKKDMSEDEKSLLIQTFFDQETKRFQSTGYIECVDGRKAALEYHGIIYRSSNFSRHTSFAYNLQPYVLQLFNKNLKNGMIEIKNNMYKFNIK